MRRWLQAALLLVLSLLLGASRCGADEGMDLEALREDVAPPFDYALYGDAQGRLAGGNADVLLVHRSAHLERVYADAQRGDPRAQALFHQLETRFQASGAVLADQALGMVCPSLPTCTVRWQFLDELMPSPGAGGLHLRQVLAASFAQAARQKQVQNTVITAALGVLMVGGVVEKAEAATAAKEASALAVGASLSEGLAAEEAAALQARLTEAEALESGARHPAQVETLARYRPSLEQPPAGVALGNARWGDYVSYWERRYEELTGKRPPQRGAPAVKPPLIWNEYNSFRGRFQDALEFQRDFAGVLHRDIGLPRVERKCLGDLEKPLVAENVGLAHGATTELTYVDAIAVDIESLRPGRTPVVHSFSVKQRNLVGLSKVEVVQQLRLDAQEALTKYGGKVEIRRPGHPLFGQKVEVTRVHLVYDEVGVDSGFRKALEKFSTNYKIEFHFHAKK